MEVPDGGIGRMSNEDIVEEMYCDIDPAELIEALISAKFLDEISECRLYVHDWHVHSPNNVDFSLSRIRCNYANGSSPRIGSWSRN
jgi:hypothetical protein